MNVEIKNAQVFEPPFEIELIKTLVNVTKKSIQCK